MPWNVELVPFKEHFGVGEEFTCTGMEVGNQITTEYGQGTPVLIHIQHPEKSGTYSAFGQALVSQANSLVPSDFPARVSMQEVWNKAHTFQYKMLVPVDQAATDIPF